MSFRFAAAHFGQTPMFDAGASVSATSPVTPAASTATRDLTYGSRAQGARRAAAAAAAPDVKKAQEALAKAEAARAQAGIERFLRDAISAQFTWKSIVDAKAALDATGRLSKEREEKKKVYENAVADKMRQLLRAFARQAGWGVGYVNPPNRAGNHDNRFTRYVLATKLSDMLRKGPYGSWIKSFDSNAFKDVERDLKNNAEDSQFHNSAEIRQFDGFPTTDKLAFFRSAALGIGFPAAGFNAERVANMSPRAYQNFLAASGSTGFAAAAGLIETVVGTRLADVYGVPAGEVNALRQAVQFTPGARADVSTAFAPATGRGTEFAPITGDYAAKEAGKAASKARDEAARKTAEAKQLRREASGRTFIWKQEKAAAEASGDTSKSAELEREKAAMDQKVKDAEARADAAEAKAREAEERVREAEARSRDAGSSAPSPSPSPIVTEGSAMTGPSTGGGGGGSVVTDSVTAPPAESLAPVVTTDATGAPAVVVPDASVVETVVMAPVAPSRVSPVMALLAVAAIGGGIWWFNRRKGA